MNGASWYDSSHHPLSITGATDASSRAGRELYVELLAQMSRAAADFPTEWVSSHISVKETFALYEVLRLLVEACPDFLKPSTITMDVDNKTMFYAAQKGRAPNEQMHKLVRKPFWLQVHEDFTHKLRWIPSEENSEVDRMNKLDAWEHIRLCQWRLRHGPDGFHGVSSTSPQHTACSTF